MKKTIHALLAVLCLITGRTSSAENVSPPVPTEVRRSQAPPGTNSNAGRGLGLEQAETPMGKDGSGLGLAGDYQPELLVQNGYKATWSPGSDRLAFGKEGGGIAMLDLHTRRVTELTREGKDPAWSPDGRYIAYVTEPGTEYVSEVIWLVPASGGQPVRMGNGGLPAWSKDSGQVYFHDRRSNQVLAVRVDAPDQEPAVFFAKPQSWQGYQGQNKHQHFRLFQGNNLHYLNIQGNYLQRLPKLASQSPHKARGIQKLKR